VKVITIAGRLGRDAEVKSTQGGTNVCRFSVATDAKRNGEKVTTWFDVSIFGKRGEALARYLTKGTTVCVVGDLEARTFQAKDGSTKLALGVVASEVTLLGGGQRDEQRAASPAGDGFGDAGSFDSGDDLPF
jgi:single-strand DNA-binding protein